MSRTARNGSRLQIEAGNVEASGPRRRNRLFGSRRRARRPIFIALAALACVFGSLVFVGISAATGPSKGSNVPGAAAAQGTFVTGPFDSGQLVNIVIPANSVLAPNQKIFVLECAAPNGVDPVTIDDCDGNTNYSSGTISANADGSVDVKAAGKRLYPIYALPDHVTLGETTGPATCGVGVANECVLYIGQGGGSDTGLSQPYFFSQPFQVHTDPTDSGTLNPGDGSAAPVSPVSPTVSTVTPPTQTVAADGADPATVTVTLEDTNSVGVPGKAVSLTAQSGSSSVTPVAAGGVTNANGQISFTATDSTPETVTYSRGGHDRLDPFDRDITGGLCSGDGEHRCFQRVGRPDLGARGREQFLHDHRHSSGQTGQRISAADGGSDRGPRSGGRKLRDRPGLVRIERHGFQRPSEFFGHRHSERTGDLQGNRHH